MPVNVNFRYQAHELRYLLDNSDARALVHAAEFSTTVQEATGLLDGGRPAPPARGRRAVRAGPGHVHATGRVDAPHPGGRRPDLPLHRRHHRRTQGRDVAQRRPVRRALGVVASRRPRAARSVGGGARGQAGVDVAPRGTADARHRPLRRRRRARRQRHRRAGRPPRSRSRAGLGRRRARGRADAHHRRRRVRPPVARRAARRTRPLGPLVAARDHVVGCAVQPRGEARPARPARRCDHRRLARRIGGPRPAPVGARGRRRDLPARSP